MNEILDLMAVLVVVAVASGFLLRRHVFRRKQQAGSGCGRCDRCG